MVFVNQNDLDPFVQGPLKGLRKKGKLK